MVPVKIECECGQRYAFDIEPVNGQMPSAIACPTCGADGTTAANEFISQQNTAAPVPVLNPQPAQVSTPRTAVPVENTPRRAVGFDKAEREARAKMMWGDPMEQVAAYLTVQGLSRTEAMELAGKLFQERAAIVRSNGIKKIIVGIVLACVPVAGYFLFHAAGRFPIRLSVVCYAIGIYGAYMFITGILAVIAPKSEKGSVAKE